MNVPLSHFGPTEHRALLQIKRKNIPKLKWLLPHQYPCDCSHLKGPLALFYDGRVKREGLVRVVGHFGHPTTTLSMSRHKVQNNKTPHAMGPHSSNSKANRPAQRQLIAAIQLQTRRMGLKVRRNVGPVAWLSSARTKLAGICACFRNTPSPSVSKRLMLRKKPDDCIDQ